ncbi:MAG: preprotein translocase subunit SecE [Candidatus Parcubacteria bacterium]|nr:preprotein translocase subunit SecE [Candidatus Parcubacteria bacterium]
MNSESIPAKISTFLKEVVLEIKKVTWPSRDQTIRYTLIVVGISVAVAIFLGGLDAIFNLLRQRLISI